MMGIWIAYNFKKSKFSTSKIDLIELGPGRGTMMADILRVCRKYSFGILFLDMLA